MEPGGADESVVSELADGIEEGVAALDAVLLAFQPGAGWSGLSGQR